MRCVPALVELSQNGDVEAARQAIGTLANLAEEIDTHELIAKSGGGRAMAGLMNHDSLDIFREASRAISNLLTSFEHQAVIIEQGLSGLNALALSTDSECQYHAALSLRKLSPNLASHRGICFGGGLEALFHLLKAKDFKTRRQAATALRDLCAHADHKIKVGWAFYLWVLTCARNTPSDTQVRIILYIGLRELSDAVGVLFFLAACEGCCIEIFGFGTTVLCTTHPQYSRRCCTDIDIDMGDLRPSSFNTPTHHGATPLAAIRSPQ